MIEDEKYPDSMIRQADSMIRRAYFLERHDLYKHHDEARKLYYQAKDIYASVLGLTHHKVIDCLQKLADLYSSLNETDSVYNCLIEKLNIEEQRFGSNHPKIVKTLLRIGIASTHGSGCMGTGEYEDAKKFTNRALIICEQKLGPAHPLTESAREQLRVKIPRLKRAENLEYFFVMLVFSLFVGLFIGGPLIVLAWLIKSIAG
jgi:hypothetical protein